MIKSHDIACCGVAFSPCGQYLASGDLAGGVWITQQDDIMPKYKCSVSTLESAIDKNVPQQSELGIVSNHIIGIMNSGCPCSQPFCICTCFLKFLCSGETFIHLLVAMCVCVHD